MDDAAGLTVAEASRRIRTREMSVVEIAGQSLERISRREPTLHAFVTPPDERTLDSARQADMDIASGRWKGPLHGIPIALKDMICTRNWPTTANSAVLREYQAAEDAHVVESLERAGAIIFGKASCWEFACGGSSEDVPWPPARHPWNSQLDPGGSSSGSAVAVAAGFCLAALGTDTGGSIRAPSAYCGLAGFKPTYGLVSQRGVLPLAWSLDHVGPMCRTSEDCLLLMEALATPDRLNRNPVNQPLPNFQTGSEKDIEGLRIGIPSEFFEDCEADVRVAFHRALEVLQAAGTQVREVDCSPLGVYQAAAITILKSEAFAVHERRLLENPGLYGRGARMMLASSAFTTASQYVNALRVREKLIRELARVFEEIDLLVLPTRPSATKRFGTLEYKRNYTMPFNLTGNPALTVCTGLSQDGLPLAMQIVGRSYEDDRVLRIGRAYEQARGEVARSATGGNPQAVQKK